MSPPRSAPAAVGSRCNSDDFISQATGFVHPLFTVTLMKTFIPCQVFRY